MSALDWFIVIWGPIVLIGLAPAIFALSQDVAEWVRAHRHDRTAS